MLHFSLCVAVHILITTVPPQLEAILLSVENKDKQNENKETSFCLLLYMAFPLMLCNNRTYESAFYVAQRLYSFSHL